MTKITQQLHELLQEKQGEVRMIEAALHALKTEKRGGKRLLSSAAIGKIKRAQKVRWAKWRKEHSRA